MRKLFLPLLVLTAAMFAYAPIAIANAPYESTMLLIQKIFYFHVPSWIALTAAIDGLRRRERDLPFRGSPSPIALPSRRRADRALRPLWAGHGLALGAKSLGHLVGMGRRA